MAVCCGVALLALGALSRCGDPKPTDPCDPKLARAVVVDYEGEEASVELGDLPGTLEGEQCLVSLAAIAEAADLGVDLEDVFVDLQADDGFRPSTVECALLSGALLTEGVVDRRTGFVIWPEALDLRGCYFIRGLLAILVRDASELP